MGKVLFINASREYEKNPEVKKLNKLGTQNIDRIVNAYREFEDIPYFSRVVELPVIKENDCNLSVSRYVSPVHDEIDIDITKVWKEIEDTENARASIRNQVVKYLKELGYA